MGRNHGKFKGYKNKIIKNSGHFKTPDLKRSGVLTVSSFREDTNEGGSTLDDTHTKNYPKEHIFSIDHSILRLVSILIGGMSIILGYLLFIKGVTGEASLSIDSKTVSGQLINAAPGLFFTISGVAIIFFALFKKQILEVRKVSTALSKKKKDAEKDIESSDNLDMPTFLRKQID